MIDPQPGQVWERAGERRTVITVARWEEMDFDYVRYSSNQHQRQPAPHLKG